MKGVRNLFLVEFMDKFLKRIFITRSVEGVKWVFSYWCVVRVAS